MIYQNEREGQLAFYKSFLPRVNSEKNWSDFIANNTDGVIEGNILEFKLLLIDINATIFQVIKYLSSFRIRGVPVPRNILLVSLNDNVVYRYNSEDFLEYIEKIYVGSASLNNTGFVMPNNYEQQKYDLSSQLDAEKLVYVLRESRFTKINLDENCIVGWARKYYIENPNAKKSDFIGDLEGKIKIVGEIRSPRVFGDYINPYPNRTNIRFKYLLDKLNDSILKKQLGAFYTPKPYVIKSLELLRNAIQNIPKGNDYIILDRCAGTGNLEAELSIEELSHVIVSTLEYYEYKVLLERLGDKVRHIIPPIETETTFNAGLVHGADALTEEFINNTIIKQYIDNPNCSIILFENPPYVETTSSDFNDSEVSKEANKWKKQYVVEEMKRSLKDEGRNGLAVNDLGNVFVWSGFKYYLRQPTDSYILYMPVKYWKSQHLIDKKFMGGFAFNRKHFHAETPATTMVAHWSNIDEVVNEFDISAYDIDTQSNLLIPGDIPIVKVRRIFENYSDKYYDKRLDIEDKYDGIVCELNGKERIHGKIRIKKKFNTNIIGYLCAYSAGFDKPRLNGTLTIAGRYDGNGFWLRHDNCIEKLPLFAAARYADHINTWQTMSFIFKSADKYIEYTRDVRNGKLRTYLLKVLLWTSLTHLSHMRSFTGSDNRFYKNQLCLDNTNGETFALNELKKLQFSTNEETLINQWFRVLDLVKKTEEYNHEITYGVYQIDEEINVSVEYIGQYENIELKPKYIELYSELKTLKTLVREYYVDEIVQTLFDYEFLK